MDDVAVATSARNAPAASKNDGLLLLLSLSLSPASKAIAKAGGRHHHHHHHRRSSHPEDDHGGAFRCRTCGRAFAMFQALGGHRTSHKRPRVRADGLDLLLGARPGKGAAASDVHRCHACGVVFPTGQALGGHMRKHRATFEFDVSVTELETTVPATESAESLEQVDEDDENHSGHLSTRSLIQFI